MYNYMIKKKNTLEEVLQYVKQEKNRFLDELVSFLKIPSISADSKHKEDIIRCAKFVAAELRKIGLDRTKIFDTEGNPIVYGEWLRVPGKPTVLCYGHYDVQPVDPLEEWKSPPFEPSIRDEKIYARGASDDKGQLFTHFKAVETYLKMNGSLPVNVKFIIEGGEEMGSGSIEDFVASHQDLLRSDVVLISDTSMLRQDVPSISCGLRGIACFQLEIVGTSRDLHSGSFGGAVVNPIFVLCHLFASLKDKVGKIKIPGFYDKVQPLSKVERQEMARLPFNEDEYKKEIGAPELFGEKGFSVLERVGARPTLEINGISGGFTGEGFKTVIPARVMAKISIRLVPNQDPAEISGLFEEYLRKICPPTVKLEIQRVGGVGKPWLIPFNSPSIQAAAKAIEKSFGKYPVFPREGGSIPVVTTFSDVLHVPVVLMGFGLPDDNIHAPNEKLDLNNFYNGIKSVIYFFQEITKT